MLSNEKKKEIADKIIGAVEIGATFTVDNDEMREVLKDALIPYSYKLESTIADLKYWKEVCSRDDSDYERC